MAGPWRIELLGDLRATQGDRVVKRFRSQQTGALLAYLAFHPQRAHQREELIELLWPECAPRAGRQRLNIALSSLRHQLESPPPSTFNAQLSTVIVADRAAVRLHPEAITTDVAEFQAALRAARLAGSGTGQIEFLAQAVERYQGELLPGSFEDWVLQERQWLGEQYFAALGQLLAHLERARDWERALDFARQGVRVDPLREEVHHDLIRLLVAAGHPEAALGQYGELARLMDEQLGTEPSPEVQAFAAEIRSQVQSADRARTKLASTPAAAARVPAYGCGNLPFQLTRFFGRKPEIARLRALLQTKGTRLVTLSGPGGSGKTRLALETVGRLRKVWPGGIWFVPLQDLTDPRLIPAALLDAMRLPRTPHVEPLEQLVAILSGQPPRLLILDNFDHLVSEGTLLVRALLEQVAPLTLLVTSRQRLGLPGEHQFPVPPLPVPVQSRELTVERPTKAHLPQLSTLNSQLSTLASCPSVRLFVDRAQTVRSEFQLTAANASAVAGLCTRLEGLPLALELAAARIGVLTPEEMLLWLERRFEFLVSRVRLADRRHQSLRAALDGSFRLLDPELQRFFVRLSVFQGGWTSTAAEAVCESAEALERLERLRECSLVLAEVESVVSGQWSAVEGNPDPTTHHSPLTTQAAVRFRLLETIREYARDRLLEAGETSGVRERHQEYYLQWAEQAATRALQQDRLDLLEAEHGNLRAALAWTIETGNAAPALRLATVLGPLWSFRGYLTEGRERLAAVLTLPEAQAHTETRALALNFAGNLALDQGDHREARAFYEEALVIWQELGNSWYVAGLLHNLGVVSLHQGDYPRASACFENNLARWRAVGEKGGIAATLGNLAKVARGEGDYERAFALAGESLALGRELGDASLVCPALLGLGHAVLLQRDYARAGAFFRESLALDPEGGSLPDIARNILGLAGVARGKGHLEHAARLRGAAVALLDRMGVVLSAADCAEHDHHLADVRVALGEEAFADAWAEGCAMSLKQVLAYALSTEHF